MVDQTTNCPDHPDAAIDVISSDSYSDFGDLHVNSSEQCFCAECGRELKNGQ